MQAIDNKYLLFVALSVVMFTRTTVLHTTIQFLFCIIIQACMYGTLIIIFDSHVSGSMVITVCCVCLPLGHLSLGHNYIHACTCQARACRILLSLYIAPMYWRMGWVGVQ